MTKQLSNNFINHSFQGLSNNTNQYQKITTDLGPINQTFELVIQSTFGKINSLILLLDKIAQNKLQAYQIQTITIVKIQIDRMKEEITKIINQYNDAIKVLNKDLVIQKIQTQLQYYRAQGLKLHHENKKLSSELNLLRNKVNENKLQIQNGSLTLKSMTKKYLILKHRRKQEKQYVKLQPLPTCAKSNILLTEQNNLNNNYSLSIKKQKSKYIKSLKRYNESVINRSYGKNYSSKYSELRKSFKNTNQ